MIYELPSDDDSFGGAEGLSYAGVLARAERAELLDLLGRERFTGWVGPQEGDWVVAVADSPAGVVAGSGRDLDGLAAEVAQGLATTALAARVHRDRVLHLTGWYGSAPGDGPDRAPALLGRYVSDPSVEAPDDDEIFPEPDGAEHAPALAQACGRPQVAEELTELLAEVLDPDSVFESERLASALRLLDLPSWLVAASSLPRDVPGGPRRGELTRLGSGRTGVGGQVVGRVSAVVRRRRRPRPAP